MLLFKLLCALMPIMVHALNLPLKRQFSVVLSDTKTVDLNVRNTTTYVNAFNGTTRQFVNVIQAEKNLESSYDKANTDCSNSPVTAWTDAQSQQLIDYLNATFLPDITFFADSLINNYKTFNASGLRPYVSSFLQRLKPKANTLFDCTAGKTATSKQVALRTVRPKIIAQYDRAIQAYAPPK